MQATHNFLRMMAGNGAASRMLVRRMQPIRMLSYSTTETSQKKEEPNQEEPKKPKKRVSHAFFTSWYLLCGAGFVRWYMNKQSDKNGFKNEAKLNRRASGAGLDYANKINSR